METVVKSSDLSTKMAKMINEAVTEEEKNIILAKFVDSVVFDFSEAEQAEFITVVLEQLSYKDLVTRPEFLLRKRNIKITRNLINWFFAFLLTSYIGILFSTHPLMQHFNKALGTVMSVMGF